MNRFYCPDLDSRVLDVAESRHAVQVLRLSPGDQAKAFNGRGTEALIELVSCSSKRVEYRIISKTETTRPTFSLSIGQAITKGKSWDLILQKLTELGVQEIHPLTTGRTVVRLDEGKGEHKTEKWEQTLVEACKQCGQNWIPKIHPPVSTEEFCEKIPAQSLKLIASLQPNSTPLHDCIKKHFVSEPSVRDVFFMVGPEGDFTPEETSFALHHGFLPVTLGPNVLRSETAALFMASVLLYELRAQTKT